MLLLKPPTREIASRQSLPPAKIPPLRDCTIRVHFDEKHRTVALNALPVSVFYFTFLRKPFHQIYASASLPVIRISENNDPNAKIKPHQLTDLGLIQLGDNGYYETFVDRIMFPICDEKGNVITFAGRTIKDEEPKYLHTKETPIFHKKELLYNYHDAKKYSYNDELYIYSVVINSVTNSETNQYKQKALHLQCLYFLQ